MRRAVLVERRAILTVRAIFPPIAFPGSGTRQSA
jgi:hypothetical protein